MNWFNILSLLGSITCFGISIYVYCNVNRGSIHKWYAFSIFSIGFWTFDSFFMNFFVVPDGSVFILYHRLLYLGAITSQCAFINWARYLRKNIRRWENLVVNGLIFLSLVTYILNFTNIFIRRTSEGHFYFSNFIEPGNLYFVFVFLVVGCSTFGTFLVYRQMREETGQDRMRLLYIIIGTITMYTAGYIYFSYVYKFKTYPVADFFVFISNLIFTYAIVRYQLMDIEVIIKKTLVFAGLLASVFAMLILPTLLIQEYLVRSAGPTGRLIGLTISGIVIILTMRRIETFLINVTDRYLFQKKYNYKELLKTFTGEVLTVLDLDNLIKLTVANLSDIIKLKSSAVLLFDDNKQEFRIASSYNIKDPNLTLIKPDGVVTFMEATHGYIMVKELSQKKIFIPDSVQEIIDKLNAELLIPMVLHEKIIGILSLGKKKSDEDYTQDDLDILLPLARTLAIAISNAQLFVELGKTQAEAAQKEKMAVIGTLAAGMAHEIRNPITTIKIFSEYLPDKLGDEEFRNKYKKIVVNEVDKIDHIIQTMIDFSSDETQFDGEAVSIYEAVDELTLLADLKSGMDGKSRINVVKDIPPALSPIRVNRKEFDEILSNLTQNAIHAIDGNGTITFKASEDGDFVSIEVKDTGCGMPPEILKNIFSPFFTTKSKGFGLGLFVVNELVKRNKGKIAVGSKIGQGTAFKLEFPKA